MVRSVIGGLVAGLVMFFIGFVFWGTPLSEMAFSKTTDNEAAAVQLSLAQNLSQTGTGTYVIPAPTTPQGTTLYGQGPIATVHFNTGGFAAEDMSMMLPGLIFALVSGLLMSFGIAAVGRDNSFAQVARLVVLFSLGFTAWAILAQPVFNHYGWGYWVYLFVSETVAFIAAGLVIARWFVPAPPTAAAAPVAQPVEAPSES
ncbi:MAG TPA: hypothetical protein VLK25_00445 [Allosphingosinicella sp.]|nr:hypothetical protein [Allosphingosinicella sp.]